MDGRAAHAAGQRRPAHTRSRVTLTAESRATNAPARLPFLLLLFFWVSKRKEDFKVQKKFLRPKNATRPGIEDWFCVPTLEKEGTIISCGRR